MPRLTFLAENHRGRVGPCRLGFFGKKQHSLTLNPGSRRDPLLIFNKFCDLLLCFFIHNLRLPWTIFFPLEDIQVVLAISFMLFPRKSFLLVMSFFLIDTLLWMSLKGHALSDIRRQLYDLKSSWYIGWSRMDLSCLLFPESARGLLLGTFGDLNT